MHYCALELAHIKNLSILTFRNEMMKKILWLLCSGLIPLACLLAALYLFDPFQFYHKPYFRKTIFDSNMHYQAAGIINNYEFDSIILGSSIMVNTSSFEANKKLKGNWVNLSVSGGSIHERIDILKHALRMQKIKNIIFTLEPGWLGESKSENPYKYLYDDNRINDFKTYIDENFILCLVWHKICLRGEESLDRPSQWGSQSWREDLLGGFDSWLKNSNRPDIEKILHQILNFKPSNHIPSIQEFPKDLYDIILKHPQISFVFIIPPFSRLKYKLENIDFKNAISELLLHQFSNVQIHGFDHTDIPDNLAHYIDLVHYDSSINSMMLDAIYHQTHRITLQNIDAYFKIMKERILNYDLVSLQNKILMLSKKNEQ